MPIQLTASVAANLQRGAPLLASCVTDNKPNIFGGPCKEGGGKIVTMRDYIMDCIADALDNDEMSFQGIDDIEFDLDFDPTRCFLLTRDARPDSYETFRWKYKWLGDTPVPIRNDPEERTLPEGVFRRFLGQTLRRRADNGDRHSLTGFLINGVYDRLACLLVHQIKFAKPGKRKATRRAAYFVDRTAAEV